MADELEEERRAGKVLAESRLELLAQFVEEERRLDGTLATTTSTRPNASVRRARTTERRLEFSSPTKPISSTGSLASLKRAPETPDGWIRGNSVLPKEKSTLG